MKIQEKRPVLPGAGPSASALLLSCFLLFFLSSMMWLSQRQENLAGRIAPGILRLHVIGNSNSKNDQELKLEVKSYFLELLSKREENSKEALSAYITKDKEHLEAQVDKFIQDKGFRYGTDIRLENTYFPEKTYGDITLPCGDYDAVSVRLGDARGRNWWCVLYPRLCFLDITHGVVPPESKKLLKETMTPEDYQRLTKNAASPASQPEDAAPFNIRFYFLDHLEKAIQNH